MSDRLLSNVSTHHSFREIAQRADCAYLTEQLLACVRVHGAAHAALPVREGQQEEPSDPGRPLLVRVVRVVRVDGGVGRGAERGARRRAQQEPPMRVRRSLGAQPDALGRRLVVRVQPLVGDSAAAAGRRAAPLQVHPEGPAQHRHESK